MSDQTAAVPPAVDPLPADPPSLTAESVPGHTWRYFREVVVAPPLVQAVRISGPFTVDGGDHVEDGWLVLDGDGNVEAVSVTDFPSRFEAAPPEHVAEHVAATQDVVLSPDMTNVPGVADESLQIQHGIEPLRVTDQGLTLTRDPAAPAPVEADRSAGMPVGQLDPVGDGQNEPDAFVTGSPQVAGPQNAAVAPQGSDNPGPIDAPPLTAADAPVNATEPVPVPEGSTSPTEPAPDPPVSEGGWGAQSASE